MVSFPFSWPRSSSDSVVPTATAVDDGEGVRSSETSTVDDDAEENQEEQKQQQQRQPLNLLKVEEELGDWDLLVRTLRRSVDDIAAGAAGASQAAAAERVLTDAVSRISTFLDGASDALSPGAVQDLVVRASNTLAIEESAGGFRAAADDVVRAAEELARKRGLDVSDVAERARKTARYTEDILR